MTLTDVLLRRCRRHRRRPLTSGPDYSFAPLRLSGGFCSGKIQVRKELFDVLMGSIVRRGGKKRFAAATG